MYKVTKAETYIACEGAANAHVAIRVTIDTPVTHITTGFEKKRLPGSRTEIYRAEAGDLVKYYSYDGPGRGHGSRAIAIAMMDGSMEVLRGPWSTRASVVNALFSDRLPCIECYSETYGVIDVKVAVLMALGLKFKIVARPAELAFEPLKPSILEKQTA